MPASSRSIRAPRKLPHSRTVAEFTRSTVHSASGGRYATREPPGEVATGPRRGRALGAAGPSRCAGVRTAQGDPPGTLQVVTADRAVVGGGETDAHRGVGRDDV